MKLFLKNLSYFSIIGIILLIPTLITYITLDPFKVIHTYDSFFDTKEKGRVGVNKDYISSSTFIRNIENLSINYDSYIFGNSRSIFYQLSDWKKHIPSYSIGYHFDASSESIWAINKKIEYIDNLGLKINNTLLVLDYSTLVLDKPKKGHLFITSPILVNNRNLISFHATFFKSFITPKFLYAYIDFIISKKIKPYMSDSHLLENTPLNYNGISNEIRYDVYENLMTNNTYYTEERMSSFYERNFIKKYSPIAIGNPQKIILQNIANVLKKHNSKTKIIINPLYDQLYLHESDLAFLKKTFGEYVVFDFSGINIFTSDYRNYYENSHYRPHIAREIMELIYQ